MYITTAEVALAGIGATLIGSIATTVFNRRADDRRRKEDRRMELEKIKWDESQEHERWKREDRDRWSDKRLAAHARMIEASRAAIDFADQAKFRDFLDEKIKSRDPDDYKKKMDIKLESIVVELMAALAGLELVAVEPVRSAAESAYRTASDAIGETMAPTMDISKLMDAVSNARNSRKQYLELAQQEIGLVNTRIAPTD
jgi:hypothetical protein